MSRIDNILNHTGLAVGEHHIFFTSLSSSQPRYFYGPLYSLGEAYASSIISKLHNGITGNTNITTDSDQKMQSYIEMIGNLSANSQNNELKYVHELVNRLRDKEIANTNGTLIKTIREFLTEIKSGKGFDYLKFHEIINTTMKQESEAYDKRAQVIANNMKLVQKNYERLKRENPEVAKQLTENFMKDMKEFNRTASKELIKIIDDESSDEHIEYMRSLSYVAAKKINSVLYKLPNNANYLGWIKSLFMQRFGKEDIANVIKSETIDRVIDNLDNDISPDQIADSIIKDYSGAGRKQKMLNKIKELETKNLTKDVFYQKPLKAIEEISLSTGKDIANLLYDLRNDQQLLSGILSNNKNQVEILAKLNSLNSNFDKKQIAATKGRITKLFNEGLKEQVKGLLTQDQIEILFDKNAEKEKRAQIINELKKNHGELFHLKKIKDQLNGLLHVKITGALAGELITGKNAEAIVSSIFSSGSKGYKADLTATITVSWSDLVIDIKDSNIIKTVEDITKNFYKNYLEKYGSINLEKGLSKNEVNVTSSLQAYEDTIKQSLELLKQLDDGTKKGKKKYDQAMQLLQNVLFTSISVKDYNFYNDELGVHGGSLGSSLGNVIDNITKMYELGGITPIEKDTIIQAAIRCNESIIGGSEIKGTLQDYLWGGAAMLMFDEGYTAASNFLSTAASNLGLAPASLQLFNIQGKFYPASLIYSVIYKNLQVAYGQIESQKTSALIGGVVHISSPVSNAMIPTDYGTRGNPGPASQPQARWDAVAASAAAATPDIKPEFVFMAGLLDVFNNIPRALNNVP